MSCHWIKPVFLAVALFGGRPGAVAGTITGLVSAKAPVPPAPEGPAGTDAYASRRYKFVEKIDYDGLTDFVINVEQNVTLPANPAPAKVVQHDAMFDPHVLPIVVHTTVRWPNEDDIYHNVFSMTDGETFDLGFYKKTDRPKEITFDKLGRVDVFCAIHTNMHCIILVLPNPYFAMADARRRYVIRDVPAGTYRLKAWHERVPGQVKEVVVPATGEVRVDFVLGVAELPQS